VQGVVRYADKNGPWLFRLGPHGKNESLWLPKAGQVDGVIARVNNPELAEQIIRSRLPTVNVSWFNYGDGEIAQCTADGEKAAELAARYFLQRGYRHFAYYGPGGRPTDAEGYPSAFGHWVEADGGSFAIYREEPGPSWSWQCDRLAEWIAARPRPLAVFTFDSTHGWQVTEACRLAGLRVPEEVAILAGDYDELMVSISTPPMSTLDPSPRRVGYEAAALLDQLMKGGQRPRKSVRVPPAGILERRSTDALAIEDQSLAAAIRFLRANAYGPLRIEDVLAQTTMSRRSFEMAFQRLVGRSPAGEIRRLRLEHARRLLACSGLPLNEIAKRCGFGHAESLSRAFRRAYSQTPAAYRHEALEM
jgi:LacI family transcriptional regulator